MVEAPKVPMPPASETAATSSWIRDAAHAGKHDGMFNVEKFGEACTHVSTVVHAKWRH
jgi:hypothetical protein